MREIDRSACNFASVIQRETGTDAATSPVWEGGEQEIRKRRWAYHKDTTRNQAAAHSTTKVSDVTLSLDLVGLYPAKEDG